MSQGRAPSSHVSIASCRQALHALHKIEWALVWSQKARCLDCEDQAAATIRQCRPDTTLGSCMVVIGHTCFLMSHKPASCMIEAQEEVQLHVQLGQFGPLSFQDATFRYDPCWSLKIPGTVAGGCVFWTCDSQALL